VSADDVLDEGETLLFEPCAGEPLRKRAFASWAMQHGATLIRLARAAQHVVAIEGITEHMETYEGDHCAALGKYVQEPPDMLPRKLPPAECDCGAQQVIDLAAAIDALGEDPR
jgi:hypothetical protein